MEDGKRKAYTKQQATVRKKKGTGTSNLSTTRKLSNKSDRPPKKPKLVKEPVVAISVERKLPSPIHGRGKGLMTGQVPGDGKCPVLLREDPQNALKQLSSILMSEDYKD